MVNAPADFTAQITDSGLDDMVRRTCVLYQEDERGAEFAAQLLAEERLTLIVISPGRFISWKEDEEQELSRTGAAPNPSFGLPHPREIASGGRN